MITPINSPINSPDISSTPSDKLFDLSWNDTSSSILSQNVSQDELGSTKKKRRCPSPPRSSVFKRLRHTSAALQKRGIGILSLSSVCEKFSPIPSKLTNFCLDNTNQSNTISPPKFKYPISYKHISPLFNPFLQLFISNTTNSKTLSNPDTINNAIFITPKQPRNHHRSSTPSEYLSWILENEEILPQGPSRYWHDFEELKKIGEGSFAEIYKCRKRIDGCIYAVKKIRRDSRCEQTVFNEIFVMSSLEYHSNILRYYDAWVENGQFYVLTEFCDGGSVSQCLSKDCSSPMTESQLCVLFKQVVSGLSHLHSYNLSHLDIKPDNILISHTKKKSTYKIGDLGLVSLFNSKDLYSDGDARYLPNEIVHDSYSDLKKADIFSLGVTLYELALHKQLPNHGKGWHELREGKLENLPEFSTDFQDLLRLMMDSDPEKRPTANELLKHKLLMTNEQKKIHFLEKSIGQLNKLLKKKKL